MGMGSFLIQNWFIVIFSLKTCVKNGSRMKNGGKSSILCWSSFTDDTMNICSFRSVFCFRLHGIFSEDEWHTCPVESSVWTGCLWVIGISLQKKHDLFMHWSTAPTATGPKLMPIITTIRQATIFLGNEFISFKTQIKLKRLYIPHCRRCQYKYRKRQFNVFLRT